MHIYHVASGTPVVTILRPALTPKGTEVKTVMKHITKRIVRRPASCGDSHYGRVEAMAERSFAASLGSACSARCTVAEAAMRQEAIAAFWLSNCARRSGGKSIASSATNRDQADRIGARVIEHLCASASNCRRVCPQGALFRAVALGLSRPAHEPPGRVPRRAADRGKSIPNALHGEWPHTDPAGRIAGAHLLNRRAKTRRVVHDPG